MAGAIPTGAEAIEAKEHIKIARRNRTLATITFQNYFRLYKKISGMTGTADTEAPEFMKIYNLDVTVIPTNRTVVRADEDDLVYMDEIEKFEAICDEIADIHKKGQPMLVGTVSIEKSERLVQASYAQGSSARSPQREKPRARSSHHLRSRRERLGHHRHKHGGPRHRHKARRQSRIQGATTRGLGSIGRGLFIRRSPPSTRHGARTTKRCENLGGLYVLGTERHESRANRQPAARPFGTPRRPGPLPVLHIARRRPHASIRRREPEGPHGPKWA